MQKYLLAAALVMASASAMADACYDMSEANRKWCVKHGGDDDACTDKALKALERCQERSAQTNPYTPQNNGQIQAPQRPGMGWSPGMQ